MGNEVVIRMNGERVIYPFTQKPGSIGGNLTDLIICHYQDLRIPEKALERHKNGAFTRIRVHVDVDPNRQCGEHVVPGSREHPYIITVLPPPMRHDMVYRGAIELGE